MDEATLQQACDIINMLRGAMNRYPSYWGDLLDRSEYKSIITFMYKHDISSDRDLWEDLYHDLLEDEDMGDEDDAEWRDT